MCIERYWTAILHKTGTLPFLKFRPHSWGPKDHLDHAKGWKDAHQHQPRTKPRSLADTTIAADLRAIAANIAAQLDDENNHRLNSEHRLALQIINSLGYRAHQLPDGTIAVAPKGNYAPSAIMRARNLQHAVHAARWAAARHAVTTGDRRASPPG